MNAEFISRCLRTVDPDTCGIVPSRFIEQICESVLAGRTGSGIFTSEETEGLDFDIGLTLQYLANLATVLMAIYTVYSALRSKSDRAPSKQEVNQQLAREHVENPKIEIMIDIVIKQAEKQD